MTHDRKLLLRVQYSKFSSCYLKTECPTLTVWGFLNCSKAAQWIPVVPVQGSSQAKQKAITKLIGLQELISTSFPGTGLQNEWTNQNHKITRMCQPSTLSIELGAFKMCQPQASCSLWHVWHENKGLPSNYHYWKQGILEILAWLKCNCWSVPISKNNPVSISSTVHL